MVGCLYIVLLLLCEFRCVDVSVFVGNFPNRQVFRVKRFSVLFVKLFNAHIMSVRISRIVVRSISVLVSPHCFAAIALFLLFCCKGYFFTHTVNIYNYAACLAVFLCITYDLSHPAVFKFYDIAENSFRSN